MKGKNVLAMRSWSPYVVGICIGVLSWFSFASVNQPLGITGPFEHTVAMIVQAVSPSTASGAAYFQDAQKVEKLIIDWEWMLVIGVFVGGYLSSTLSGDRAIKVVPSVWEERFGPNRTKRYMAAFIGGAVMMFGARIAQGCTSGHAISGALQFALSSWIFIPVFFVVAMLVAMLVYKTGEARSV